MIISKQCNRRSTFYQYWSVFVLLQRNALLDICLITNLMTWLWKSSSYSKIFWSSFMHKIIMMSSKFSEDLFQIHVVLQQLWFYSFILELHQSLKKLDQIYRITHKGWDFDDDSIQNLFRMFSFSFPSLENCAFLCHALIMK